MHKMGCFTFSLLLIMGYICSNINGLILTEPDETLSIAIQQADTKLRREIENIISQAEYNQLNAKPIHFGNMSYENNDIEVQLSNITVQASPEIKFIYIIPRLRYNTLKLNAEFRDVSLTAAYHLCKRNVIISQCSTGSLSGGWRIVKSVGRVGITTSKNIVPSNYDLKSDLTGFHIKDDKKHRGVVDYALRVVGKIICDRLVNNTVSHLENLMQKVIDRIFDKISLKNIFSPNMLDKYIEYSASSTNDVNKKFDEALKILKEFLKVTKKTEINLPDFHHELNIPLVQIYVEGNHGKASDLSTMTRKGDVQYKKNQNLIEVTTGIEFTQLSAKYDYTAKVASIGPSGTMSAEAGTNLVNIQLLLLPDPASPMGYKLKSGKAKVKELSLDTKITGLGKLDAIASKITSYLASIFKTTVSAKVEEVINSIIAKMVDIV